MEISIQPATQGLVEKEDRVIFVSFGETRQSKVLPIEVVCGKCTSWKLYFKEIEECQETQKKDAEMRGFTEVICPSQLVDW